jgi:diguanylate cyclase (GGDEF)-like protein
MTNGTGPQPAGTGAGRVLLIGDADKALLDARSVDRRVFDARVNILDGIDAAARNRFDSVAVVMDGALSQLGPVLRALRKCTDARIILLAQMHEEPIARQFVTPTPGERKLADEYLVCPASPASLCPFVASEKSAPGKPESEIQDLKSQISSLKSQISSSAGPEVSADVTHRMEQLERLATTDDLTGLKNRRYIWEFARQILDRARRTRGRVTILVFDIDNFKHYNDVYGHLTGDEILRQAAILMQRCCRSHDMVGRIGGDEFAVVFWDDPHRAAGGPRERRSAAAEHPAEAITVAKRFQQALGNADLHLLGPKGEGVLTISGGLASFPRDGSTVQQLFDRADRALLEAKRSGKNRIYLVGEPQSDIADMG